MNIAVADVARPAAVVGFAACARCAWCIARSEPLEASRAYSTHVLLHRLQAWRPHAGGEGSRWRS